jgi:hypothetical protein
MTILIRLTLYISYIASIVPSNPFLPHLKQLQEVSVFHFI